MPDPPRKPPGKISEDRAPTPREHRDYAHDRSSRAMQTLRRDEEDGVPQDDLEDDISMAVPSGLSPVQEFEFRLARARSRSNLALREAQSVRAEMRAEVTAINTKFDAIAAQVSASSAEMRTVSGVLNRQLEASQKQQELVLQAMLSAQSATTHAKNEEIKASGAHKRSLSEKFVIALIGLVLAIQTYFFASR